MKNVLKFVLLTAALLLVSLQAHAQNRVTANLIETNTGNPVPFATVSLTPEGSETVYKYVLSTEKGGVSLTSVKNGKYTFKVELMGYKTYTSQIEVKGSNLNLGDIKLDDDVEVLDAARVSDNANPIIVKKDTVEYNASSFMTTDNDMLENLLSKLPGVEVNEDGSITANGENVTRIYIDGKSFFLDDPKVASQNIPAKMVEKVKVVKKKSEQAEFSGVDDGNEETVIDLSVQPSMMDGLVGNVMAGGGHDMKGDKISDEVKAMDKLNALAQNDAFRFQSNAFVGKFKSDSQISLILNASNSGMGGMGGRGGRGGGMGGGGLSTNWMAGINGALELFDGKMELSPNYMYNGNNSISGSLTTRDETLTYGDTQSHLKTRTNSKGNNTMGGDNLGLRLEHKFSDKASIIFEPQVSFNQNTSNSSSLNTTWENDALKNDGWSSNLSEGKNVSTRGTLTYRQRIVIPGRTLTARVNWNYSKNNSESFNQSRTTNYLGDKSTDALVNQRSENLTKSASAGVRLEYTEPLGNNFYASGNYSYSWSKSNTVKDTWNSGAYDPSQFSLDNLIYNRTGEFYDEIYSNKIMNRNINQQIGANMMYQSEGIHAQIGASLMPRNILNETNGKKYADKHNDWAPNASIFADLGENSNIRIFYTGRSSQPSTNQLMPVMDNTNPTRMSLGNPYLLSYFSHNLRTEYGYTNRSTFFTTRISVNGGMTQNPIVNATWYDDARVSYSFPINGKSSKNASVSWMINTPVGNSNFRINNNLSLNYSESHAFKGIANLNMTPYFDADKKFDYVKFHDDFFGDNATKSFEDSFLDNKTQNLSVNENLRVTYRIDDFEATIGGRTRVNKPKSTIEDLNTSPTTWSNSVNTALTWNGRQSGLGLTLDGAYNWFNGYVSNPASSFILNAEITKLVFNNNATLAIRGYDLLNQTKSYSESTSAGVHTESRSLALGRFIIASLTFRFGQFGRGGRGGHGGRGQGGHGGPGMGGGRPPMGGGMPPMGGGRR